MFIRKIYLWIKRKLFIKRTGIYPEDLLHLVQYQKLIDSLPRKDVSYNDYLKEHFIKKYAEQCK